VSNSRTDSPASRAYTYYVAGLLMLVYTVNYLDRNVLVILAEPIKRELGLRDWQIGFLTGTSFAIFYAIMGLPIARLADRWHRVNICSIALIVWGGMTALCGAITSYGQLVLARIGVGVGEAGGSPPAVSLISDYFRAEHRATALGVYNLGVPFGMLLGFVVGGIINELYGWRTAFVVAGAPGVLLAVLVKLTVREPRRAPPEPSQNGSIVADIRMLLKIPLYRGMIVGATLFNVAAYGVSLWSPANMVRAFEIDTRTAGVTMGLVSGIGGALGSFLGGYVTDLLQRRDERWLLWVPAGAAAIFFPLVVIGVAMPTVNLYATLLVATYVVSFATHAPFWAVAQASVPPHRRAMAAAFLLFSTNLIGMGLGPQLAGILSDVMEPLFGQNRLRIVIPLLAIFALPAAFIFRRTAQYARTTSIA
jgi:MFS family permease